MNRQSFPFPWANGGEVTDPDLDTEHPSFVANRYQGLGWKSEKFPSEWQNFLSNLSDNKIIELLSQGLFEHREDVTYPPKAVVSVGDALYQNVSGEDQLGEFNQTAWSKPVAHRGGDYNNTVASLNKKFTDHVNKVNAHNDTVDTIIGGTQKKEFIDFAITDKTNPKTISFHIEQKGRVHGETPEQVGTLPNTGGKFLGDITFRGGLRITSDGVRLYLDGGTNQLQLKLDRWSLSLDAGGNVYWNDGSESFLVLTESNYNEIEIRVNQMFVLPTPILSILMNTSLNDVSSIGDWKIEYSGNPTFGNVGFNKTSTGLKFTGTATQGNATLCVYGVFGGATKTVCKDVSNFSFTSLDNIVSQVGDFTQVGFIKVFPRLSKYQKTMLVNSESK